MNLKEIRTIMNKQELVRAIASQTKLTLKDTALLVDAFTAVVTETIKTEPVKLTGFGVFSTVARAARKGVNPKTKESIEIPATTAPKFKAGKDLKEAVK